MFGHYYTNELLKNHVLCVCIIKINCHHYSFLLFVLTTLCPIFICLCSSSTRSTRSCYNCTDSVYLAFGTGNHVWVSVCSRLTIFCKVSKLLNKITFSLKTKSKQHHLLLRYHQFTMDRVTDFSQQYKKELLNSDYWCLSALVLMLDVYPHFICV